MSSPSDGVDHDALWLALLDKVRQPAAHTLEIVAGQACERVRLQSNWPQHVLAPCTDYHAAKKDYGYKSEIIGLYQITGVTVLS